MKILKTAVWLVLCTAVSFRISLDASAQEDVFRFRALGPTTNVHAKLSDERTWTTRTGVVLAGRAVLASSSSEIEIERVNHNGPGPGRVIAPLSSFRDADAQLLQAAIPAIKPEARQLGWLVPFAVDPQWNKAQPKIAKRYSRAVAVEPNHVIFRDGDGLYLVAKSSFEPASYAKIAEQFKQQHSGRYVRLSGQLQDVAGKLLTESESHFVFEAIDPPPGPAFIPKSVLQNGQRFRVPKHWLSADQISDLQALSKRFPLENKLNALEFKELVTLPTLCKFDGSFRYCVYDPQNSYSMFVVEAPGKTRPEPRDKLANIDFVLMEQELTRLSQPTLDISIINNNAIQLASSAARQRLWWQCDTETQSVGFRGRILGGFGPVYVFQLPDGSNSFYVLREQLSELDRRLADIVAIQTSASRLRNIELVSLFSRRLIINGIRAIPAHIGTTNIKVDSAIQGTVPEIQHASGNPLQLNELAVANLAEIERSRAFLRENLAALKANDLPTLLPEVERVFGRTVHDVASTEDSSDRPSSDSQIAASNVDRENQSLAPLPKLDRWKLLNSSVVFVGELLGTRASDWVFVVRVSGENRTFVASPEILTAESRKQGEAILAKLKNQVWEGSLTLTENWQLYRVWNDPDGKVPTPSDPAALISISDSLIRFKNIDGSESSDRMPQQDALKLAVVDFYRPALEQAMEERARAEAGLTLWKFRDCEPTLRAELLAESEVDLLVKDAKNVEFLINKACLEPESLATVKRHRESGRPLRSLSANDARTLQRVWCMRTKLVGPALPIFLTFDDRLEIVHPDGQHDFLKLSNLTLREQLSFENYWRTIHGDLKQASPGKTASDLLEELKQTIPPQNVIRSLPELRADIRRAIDDNHARWRHLTWDSVPLKLSAGARLLAINADARFGVIDEGDSGWAIVELATGKQKTIRAQVNTKDKQDVPAAENLSTLPSQICWMFRDARVYWIQDGQLAMSGGGAPESKTLTQFSQPIERASQSIDYASLVLQLADSSTHRFDLASHELRQLTPATSTSASEPSSDASSQASSQTTKSANSGVVLGGNIVIGTSTMPLASDESTAPATNLWSSIDGSAVVTYAGNMLQYHVPTDDAGSKSRVAFLGTSSRALRATSNHQAALVQTGETGLLSLLVASVTSPPPRSLGMPFSPRWFGIVPWSSSPEDALTSDADKEVIQFIGKPADTFFAKSGYFFAHQTSLNTDYKKYAYQYVLGEMNEYLRVAASGAAIVHHRDGKYVLSKRPAVIPVILPERLQSIIHELIEQRDIGQLEAIAHYLEEPRFENFGPHAGWLSTQYHTYVKVACFQYEPQVPGDRLERALVLADHLQRNYPDSQIAGNILVDIHRGLAWDARGGGYVDTVTDEGRAAFRREMLLANDLVKRLLKAPRPLAITFQSAIDISMATTDSLEAPRALAVRLRDSTHANNPRLHQLMALLLLPRWHGTPGMSEGYMQSVAARAPKGTRRALYAQQVAMLMPMIGYENPVTSQLRVDLEAIFEGTKEYYQHHTDAELLDQVIMILAVEKKYDWVRELLRLRSEKKILPGAFACTNALSFRNIEEHCGK